MIKVSSLIDRFPTVSLMCGLLLFAGGGVTAYYSILAVGVSDGPGLITARLMLAGCMIFLAGVLFLVWRSTLTLIHRL
ncbi:hypothetical protein TZ53_17170 [Sphingobium sp. YBL2]|nr:hypothetical protein TZ53_17170 [Sphingobium sp. YBL2]